MIRFVLNVLTHTGVYILKVTLKLGLVTLATSFSQVVHGIIPRIRSTLGTPSYSSGIVAKYARNLSFFFFFFSK